MRKSTATFLQLIIVLIGIGALSLLLWEPLVEGRNARATLFETYFNDPFLAYAYAASMPLFVALYQAFKLVAYAGRNELFSRRSVQSVRTIKYCAMCLVGLVVAPEAYLFIARPGDDIAGGVAIGLFLILIFAVIATTAAVFERTLRSAVDMNADIG